MEKNCSTFTFCKYWKRNTFSRNEGSRSNLAKWFANKTEQTLLFRQKLLQLINESSEQSRLLSYFWFLISLIGFRKRFYFQKMPFQFLQESGIWDYQLTWRKVVKWRNAIKECDYVGLLTDNVKANQCNHWLLLSAA